MIRSALKQLYYSAAHATGAAARRLNSLQKQRRAAILNLHRVSPERSEYWPPLSPELFEQLLRFLTTRFQVCTVKGLAGTESDKPLAVLSFDDGYLDFIEYALPLIEKYDVPVNMNVIPACAISGKPIWNVRVYDFLQASSREIVNRLDIPGFGGKLESDDPEAKVRFGVRLSKHLKNRPRVEREELWRVIEPQIENPQLSGTRMMSTAEIRQIASRVELGAHSYSHESMGFEDNDFFADDVEKCRTYFQNALGLPLSIYAFPNGSYRHEHIEFLRRSGVKKTLLVDEKFADADADVLTRITMYGSSPVELKMRSLGF